MIRFRGSVLRAPTCIYAGNIERHAFFGTLLYYGMWRSLVVRTTGGSSQGRSPDEIYLTERGGVDRDCRAIDG